jgi:xanthine dehydrogenase YagR molybdenum-binding subunit
LREGRLLIGRGLAAAIRPNMMQPAEAAAELDRDGRLTVELDMTDIGTGTYTILTQIAAETLGLDPNAIAVRLGDTDYPKTCGSGGSFGAGSTGTAVSKACASIRDTIIERAARLDSDWVGVNSGDLRIESGNAVVAGRSLALGAILDAIGGDSFKGKGQVEPGKAHEDLAQYSYGGVFAEVSVNADTGEIRVRRLAGAFDAGRILNEKTARSQLMGGMIFGLGAALMEESLMDMRFGSFMNRDLAEYHIAVNRDVPRLEVKMLDTFDQNSNPLGSKGIGELGICGTGPAIANAVYAATGYRTRKFPIHLEDLLDHLPAL